MITGPIHVDYSIAPIHRKSVQQCTSFTTRRACGRKQLISAVNTHILQSRQLGLLHAADAVIVIYL